MTTQSEALATAVYEARLTILTVLDHGGFNLANIPTNPYEYMTSTVSRPLVDIEDAISDIVALGTYKETEPYMQQVGFFLTGVVAGYKAAIDT